MCVAALPPSGHAGCGVTEGHYSKQNLWIRGPFVTVTCTHVFISVELSLFHGRWYPPVVLSRAPTHPLNVLITTTYGSVHALHLSPSFENRKVYTKCCRYKITPKKKKTFRSHIVSTHAMSYRYVHPAMVKKKQIRSLLSSSSAMSYGSRECKKSYVSATR
ncbi:hypothetical protein B0F90DRAFT_849623 [Multifurca ochricompacta]|uniref:Uncharacterized protein n=1 Tax=Multifurca ochricompacta TaxID=376703 RepID=A0AAD4M336_9AGAM|nr:hypothetical protein B0F90DRAFT_849623 [Multifurca ochricompacta]